MLGGVRFGHPTAVVGASNSSSSSSTEVSDSLEAAERLQSEMENPGALREVSKAPVSILTGLMSHLEADEHYSVNPCLEISAMAFISLESGLT